MLDYYQNYCILTILWEVSANQYHSTPLTIKTIWNSVCYPSSPKCIHLPMIYILFETITGTNLICQQFIILNIILTSCHVCQQIHPAWYSQDSTRNQISSKDLNSHKMPSRRLIQINLQIFKSFLCLLLLSKHNVEYIARMEKTHIFIAIVNLDITKSLRHCFGV